MMRDREFFDALRRFNEEHIQFPPFVAAANMIEANLTFFRETGIAQHLLILGESGTGKSSLCKLIEQKYPRIFLPDRDVLPVLSVSVPPAATISSMVDQMLERLGDPSPTMGSSSAKTARLIKLCQSCRVEMIMLDEAQHIYDRGLTTTHYMVGDWLKSLIDQVSIPTVFLGLPRFEQLLQVNEQLRRRLSQRILLALGQNPLESIHNECLQLFVSLGASLPVRLVSGAYGWEELGIRLYYASDGRVSYIKKLLACALRKSLENEMDEIGPDLLEQAFTDEIWQEGIAKLNPFNVAFEFRQLDRGNEPFERAPIKGQRVRK